MPERTIRFDGNCLWPGAQRMSPGEGAGTGARGFCCEYATLIGAPLARCAGAVGRDKPNPSAQARCRQLKIRTINTNISLKSFCQRGAGRHWYSISASQIVGVPFCRADHRKQLACSLSMGRSGGIDLPAALMVGRGLNSRQINHLQHSASETHYRGQSAASVRGSKHGSRR